MVFADLYCRTGSQRLTEFTQCHTEFLFLLCVTKKLRDTL